MDSAPRRDWQTPALIVMALAGAAIALYLTITHVSSVPLVCTVGAVVNCGSVTHSAYSVIPGTSIPISVLGILWFAISGGLALTSQRWLQLGWSALGLLVVIYLVYVEIVVLHQICEWCTGVHLLVLATLLVALRRAQTA
jgi:uncharacterized membrane protein